MKHLVLVVLCLLFSVPLLGQSTTVSGTISDASGQAWKIGTYSFVFQPSPSNPTAQYYWNGAPFSKTQTFQGDLDSAGHFSVSLPSNTSITPSGSTWIPTVCSIARGNSPCYTTQSGLTITGATQNLTSVIIPPAISIDLTHVAFPFVTAYKSQEITTATFAGLFWNYTLSHYFYCAAITPTGNDQSYGACSSWIELCQTGDTTCGGTGSVESFQHNGTLVGTQPTLNVIDTGTVVATLTNDTLNNRVNLSLAASSGTGCTVGALLDQWVVSIHPDHTCYGSVDYTWDDTNFNLQAGNGANGFTGTNTKNFVFGGSNALTDVKDANVNGSSNTITCDSNTVGANCDLFVITGGANTATGTGASSNIFSTHLHGRFNSVSATGGGQASTMMLLMRNNFAIAATAGQVDDTILAGLSNSTEASGAGSITSSIYSIGESNQSISSAGGNVEDNMQLGENNLVQADNASSVVGFSTQLGYNNSIRTSAGVAVNYGFELGHTNTTSTGATGTMNEFGMIGHNLALTNCSNCYLFGQNTSQSTSNYIGIGLSSTPEIQVTPGAVNINATTTVNGTILGSGSFATPNGYTNLPGGLILQWAQGVAATTDNTQTVTWPIAFPTACLSVLTTNLNVSGTNVVKEWGVLSFNTTGVSIQLMRRGDEGSFTAQPIVWGIGH